MKKHFASLFNPKQIEGVELEGKQSFSLFTRNIVLDTKYFKYLKLLEK